MTPLSYETVRLEHELRLARIQHSHLAVVARRRGVRRTKTYRSVTSRNRP